MTMYVCYTYFQRASTDEWSYYRNWTCNGPANIMSNISARPWWWVFVYIVVRR